ncbi:MAG: class I SAM-dependent methyltransferase [bacterium]|nr:class I SAM-dependent methyltransferase [bacterium]
MHASTPPGRYEDYARFYDRTGQARFGLRMLSHAMRDWARSGLVVKRLLDVACGTGAVAVACARRGIDVVGIDASEAMLEVARARARHWGVPVDYQLQDMRSLHVPGPFDVVTCFYDSLNYLLDPAELVQVFTQVAVLLRPGGQLWCDVITEHGLRTQWGQDQEVATGDDFARIWRSSLDPESGIATLEIDQFHLDSNTGLYHRIRESHPHRGYDPFDVREAAEVAGLRLVRMHRSLSHEPATARTYRVTHVYERP